MNGYFLDTAFNENAKKSILKVNMPAEKTTSSVAVEQSVGIICLKDYEKYASVLKNPKPTCYSINMKEKH